MTKSTYTMQTIDKSLSKLISYVEEESFMGYDPYDVLNSPINFKVFGKWGPPVATQIMKRLPVNIRPLIGVKKGYNPKGLGLFLKAYSLLYQHTADDSYLEKASWLFNWLNNNYSKGYSGMCWGYNFPWAQPREYKEAYLPSVVVTAHVIDGIYYYYKVTKSREALNAINSAADYVLKDIPILRFKNGISFTYTHKSKIACYNASLHAAEILAISSFVNNQKPNELICDAIKYVLSRQKPNGSWYYSFDPERGTERKQIDFHQGFVLVSLKNLLDLTGFLEDETKAAIRKGSLFYKNEQFEPNGRSLWRLPARWPVDIHNQSQGIITFSLLKDYDPSFMPFAQTIADWTITHMQSPRGYFYYRLTPFFKNKIPYMRWSQAWMMLALATLQTNNITK